MNNNFETFIAALKERKASLEIADDEYFAAVCDMMQDAGWSPWTTRYGCSLAEYAKSCTERGFKYFTASKHTGCVTGSMNIEGDIYSASYILENNTMGEEALSLLF